MIAETAHVRAGGSSGSREVLSISFKEMGAGLSPYPFALAYPQDDHERFLMKKLKDVGCEVEWDAKLTGFSQSENGVRATIEHNPGDAEETEHAYICGCDGAQLCARNSAPRLSGGYLRATLLCCGRENRTRVFPGSLHQSRQTHPHVDVPGAVEWNAALDWPRAVRTVKS